MAGVHRHPVEEDLDLIASIMSISRREALPRRDLAFKRILKDIEEV